MASAVDPSFKDVPIPSEAETSEIYSRPTTAVVAVMKKQQNEKLGAVVDSLCVEAVDRILKIVETVEDLQAPPPSDDTCEELTRTQTAEGEDAGVQRPPTGHTFILVYGNAAPDSRSLLHRDANDANDANAAKSENRSNFEAAGDLSSSSSTSSPPPQVEDHEYARLSVPPPGVAAAAGGGVRKDGRRQRKKKKSVSAAETQLPCSRCSMLFPSAERLSDHQQKSHPACSVCGALFTGILKLREHEISAHGLLPYACDFCPKRFNHKAHRNLHVKARHTGEKSCHCDICGKGYSCVSVLKTHRMTHFDKTFTCDVCGKSFYHACHLTRHKLVHQEVRPYPCSTCGKGFTQAANLRSHQLTHTGERQLCSICGKSFRYLKNHVISKHSHELPAGELPAANAVISCEVCCKKFPNPSQYRAHKRSHTGEKPFHCDICGKSYRLKELLRDHRYTHTGEKPYSCSLCSKTFNLATSFMRHRSIHTGETPYSCHDCGKHFRLLTFLKAHLQTKAHLKQTQQRQVAAVTSDL
ncbi:zinc finger protein 708-like isoform X2 [Melanotaenia boesemani]|uniref:zinc finger protein 708-like isoform X2 n=1 Tax=Melanotaenia boesemani TaxID=1250792 RepID=UPI001C04964F|nr:zinc finger protein 708-like isoform X2 [Melanotaenia boesemani]